MNAEQAAVAARTGNVAAVDDVNVVDHKGDSLLMLAAYHGQVNAVVDLLRRGARNTRNPNDGIYNSLSTNDKAALTLQASTTIGGYAGVINLGVKVG